MTNCAQAYWDGKGMRDCSFAYGHEGDHGRKRSKITFSIAETALLVGMVTLPVWAPYTGLEYWVLFAIVLGAAFVTGFAAFVLKK